ncbi:MAG: hypothetical protein SGPRY_012925 [Prymnesium sp.]
MSTPPFRLYAPSDERTYVLLAPAPATHCLVISRTQATFSLAPLARLDQLIGSVGKRAKSCAVLAVVGLFSFPDDRSLVVVTDQNPRTIASERGPVDVCVVTKTAFLPLKPPQPGVVVGEAEKEEATVGAKQRWTLKEFLEAGDFFFCPHTQITLTIQKRAAMARSGEDLLSYEGAEERFFWNKTALAPFLEAGRGTWLTPIMQGAVFTEQIVLPTGGQLFACLISRRSVEHAGTRFKTRGIDDEGACANFVEIEQILCLCQPGRQPALTSLVQVRRAPLGCVVGRGEKWRREGGREMIAAKEMMEAKESGERREKEWRGRWQGGREQRGRAE